jgi:hypothetical protein
LTLTAENANAFDYKYIQARETPLGVHFNFWLESKIAFSAGSVCFITYMSNLGKTITYVAIPTNGSGGQNGVVFQTTSGCFNIRIHQYAPAGTGVYLSTFLPIASN